MGNLFIVATPIGNLQDISLRALETLENADFIACEDTRRAFLLIGRFFKGSEKEMKRKLFSYYEEKENVKIPQVLNLLYNGKNVALISDAGTPLISDPGYKLVRECIENKIKVISVPGASSVISSLVVSGLPTDKFLFLGFLPQKPGHRLKFLEKVKDSLKGIQPTVVFFESPHKFLKNLTDLGSVFGDIDIVVVRENTKMHEEVFAGKISEVANRYEKGVRGEITVLFNTK